MKEIIIRISRDGKVQILSHCEEMDIHMEIEIEKKEFDHIVRAMEGKDDLTVYDLIHSN